MKIENLRALNGTTTAIYNDHGTRVASINQWYGNNERRKALAEMFAAAPKMRAALQQIERLSREADRGAVDVPAMLGDIAREALK